MDAGELKQAARRYAQLVRLFERRPDLDARGNAVPVTLDLLAIAQSWAGDHKGASRTYARLAQLRESRGEIAEVGYASEGAARHALGRGKLQDAERYARSAIAAG